MLTRTTIEVENGVTQVSVINVFGGNYLSYSCLLSRFQLVVLFVSFFHVKSSFILR
jgi:hypothetical protein